MIFTHLPVESNVHPYHFTTGNFLFKNKRPMRHFAMKGPIWKSEDYFTGHKWASTVDVTLVISL